MNQKKVIISVTLVLLASIVIYKITSSRSADLPFKNISREVFVYEDISGSLTLDDILRADYQNRFKLNDREMVTYNISTSAIWIKFGTNATEQMDLCQLNNPNLHEVTYYRPLESGQYEQVNTGFLKRFDSREIVMDRFTFKVGAAGSWHYIRIKSGHFLNTTLLTGSSRTFQDRYHNRLLFFGMYTCLVLAIAGYTLIQILFGAEIHFTYYLLYVLSIGSINLFEKGILFQFFWPELPILNYCFSVLVFFTAIIFMMFVRHFLRSEWTIKLWIWKAFWGLSCVLICIMLIRLSVGDYVIPVILSQCYSLLVILSIVTTAIVNHRRIRRLDSYLITMLIGLFFLMVSVVLYILVENSIIGYVALAEYSIILGSIFEVICFTLSMTLYQSETRNRLLEQGLQLVHEKKSIELELDEKNRKLVSFATEQIRQNEALEKLRIDLPSEEIQTKKRIQNILTTDNNWSTFKLYFENVNPEFFGKLRSRFPDLTPNEVRLCAFIKMGLSSKEIASLQSVTKRGVDKARERLYKKVKASGENDLLNVLMDL